MQLENRVGAAVQVVKPHFPISLWMIAEVSSTTELSPTNALDRMNEKVIARFRSTIESPRQFAVGAVTPDGKRIDLQPLPWPPRGFPAAVCDFEIERAASTSTIRGVIHLPYGYGLIVALMIVAPLALCVLSRSVVGVPVAAIGAISYIAGRLQGGSSTIRDVVNLIDFGDGY